MNFGPILGLNGWGTFTDWDGTEYWVVTPDQLRARDTALIDEAFEWGSGPARKDYDTIIAAADAATNTNPQAKAKAHDQHQHRPVRRTRER